MLASASGVQYGLRHVIDLLLMTPAFGPGMRWVPDVIGVSGFGVAAHADNIAVAIMAPIEAIVFLHLNFLFCFRLHEMNNTSKTPNH